MFRTFCAATALFFGLACVASAGTVVLSDSSLLGFSDVGGSGGGDLHAITDIAGDPGVQFDFTLVDRAGYTDIAIGKYSPTELGFFDTWEVTLKNLDPLYPTYARLYSQVDGWSYSQGAGMWLAANGGTGTISHVIPATSVVNAIGIKLGTDDWTGRPTGSTISVQVIVPEPSTLVMLALGGLFLARKRR